MRPAAISKKKRYARQSTPARRDLLRLYDIASANSDYLSFQLNDHMLDSRSELETYPVDTITEFACYSAWRFEGRDASASVYFSAGSASCYITNDRHSPSMAVMAVADDIFRSVAPAEAKSEAPAAASPEETRRKLTAILHADAVGYSRLTAIDEAGTLRRLEEFRSTIIEPGIDKWHGYIVGSAGDSFLVSFSSALDAITGAMEMQHALAVANASVPEDQRLIFRMGINLGDVIAKGGTIHGDDVNIAERVEKLASPGGLCITSSMFQVVNAKLDFAFDDLGEKELKNIGRPIRVYRVRLPSTRKPIEWI
jgi:class 3 adenylate cyclase